MNQTVKVFINGQSTYAKKSDLISSVLWKERIYHLNTISGNSLGMYCAVGRCENCIVRKNGINVKACITPVENGMEITTNTEEIP